MIAIIVIAWFVYQVARGAGFKPWRATWAMLAVALGLMLAAHAEGQAAHHHGTPRWKP